MDCASMLQRTRDDCHAYRLGAMQFENAGTFIDGGAGSHDVINQQNTLLREVSSRFEGAPDITVAFLEREICLAGCRAGAQDAAAVNR